jgi:hypothetical protein
MEMEHCTSKGANEFFVTNNYKITTRPIDEWHLTVHADSSKATPAVMEHGRRLVPIDELMNVDVAVKAKLTRPEVIAVVLYTGPMVSKLSSICILELRVHAQSQLEHAQSRLSVSD